MRQAALHIASQSIGGSAWVAVVNAALVPLRWWKRRRTMVRLIDLDDHILADIGISRDDVREVMRLPLGTNADHILQMRAATCPMVMRVGWRQS